jgi:hypothetical protein
MATSSRLGFSQVALGRTPAMSTRTTFIVALTATIACVTPTIADTFELHFDNQVFHIEKNKSEIQSVTSAAIAQPGSALCDKVYYEQDEGKYILGGCNLGSVPYYSSIPGFPRGVGHGRLKLRRLAR